jgi:uncharacterized LabA/DUF88 family protein
MLLIDGAFMTMGAKPLQKKTNRKIDLNETTFKILFDYIEQKSGVKFHPKLKHYVAAEDDELEVVKRWDYYENIKNNGCQIDIRTHKGKNAYCPEKGCLYSDKPFQIKVQAEVDVAIVMKVMDACFKDEMEELVLLAGDGDFKDMLDFVVNTMKKKLIVFSWNSCVSKTLLSRARDNYHALDDIWEHISTPLFPKQISEGKKEVCQFFLQGNCRYGEKCKDLHQQVC